MAPTISTSKRNLFRVRPGLRLAARLRVTPERMIVPEPGQNAKDIHSLKGLLGVVGGFAGLKCYACVKK